MRIAAIDIGTNSIHMIVAQVRPDLSFEVVDCEKEMVRLGAGGLDGRALTPEAMHAALQVMSKFRRLAESHRVDEIIAAATSATREAENGGEFLDAVSQQTGIHPRVIRGTGPVVERGRSFKLGVIRLTERFVKTDPLEPRDERKLLKHINTELGDYLDQIAAAGFDRLIGTSGTILSLGAVASAQHGGAPGAPLRSRRISAKQLRHVRKEIVGVDL